MDNVFLSALRSATDAEHKALEATPLSMAIVSSELTTEQYTEYLRSMAVVHQTIESLTFPLLGKVISDLDSRGKLNALKHDLEILGASFPDETAATEGFNPTPAFALGTFYVAEGSTLGGRVILKNLQKVLNEKDSEATHFFEGYRELTGPKWKQFIDMLLSFEEKCTEEESNEIIEGAKFGFALTSAVFANSEVQA